MDQMEHKPEDYQLQAALLQQKSDISNEVRTMIEGAVTKLTDTMSKQSESSAAFNNVVTAKVAALEVQVKMINFKIITASTTVGAIVGGIVFILDRTVFK